MKKMQWPRRRSLAQRRRSSTSLTEASFEAFQRSVVPAFRWGITKPQFIEFLNVVRAYQKKGLLFNIESPSPLLSSRDKSLQRRVSFADGIPSARTSQCHYSDAKFNDPNVGPSIYQINHQIIKPLTKGMQLDDNSYRQRLSGWDWDKLAAKGAQPKSSWALMKNPEGVNIDLFVSHAWAEGIFEFANHLLNEWPDDCHAAYICFLSNPQNLDTDLYLGSPGCLEEYAFYQAIQSQHLKRMVMISTPNLPIHRRAWCCYEAYLALQRDLPVTIGGDKKYLATMVREYRKTKKLEKNVRHVARHRNLNSSIRLLLDAVEFVSKWLVELVTILAICLAVTVLFPVTVAACFLTPIILLEDRLPTLVKIFVAAPCKALYFAFCGSLRFAIEWLYSNPFLKAAAGLVYFVFFPLIFLLQFLWAQASGLVVAVDEAIQKRVEEQELNEIIRIDVDVGLAQASTESDRKAILSAIGEDVKLVNSMLTKLILGEAKNKIRGAQCAVQ